MPEVYLLNGVKSMIGENPLWDLEEERLYWVDVTEGLIFRSTADGREVRLSKFPGHLSSLALRKQGGAIVASGKFVYLYDFATGERETVFEVDAATKMGFNDAKVDRQGRFVTGLVDRSFLDADPGAAVGRSEPSASLYRVDSDLKVEHLSGGFAASNGPCFSPEGTTLYWNDSFALRTYAFDYDPVSGTAANRRILVDFADTEAGVQPLPDGATVDEEGFVWIAALYAGEIRRYAPDGELDRRVQLPLMKPLGVAFGGPEMDILYVTTMGADGFPGDTLPATPLAGSVLAVHGLGVRGIPERRFEG